MTRFGPSRPERRVLWLDKVAERDRNTASVVAVPGQYVGSMTADVPPRVSARGQALILCGSFENRLAAPIEETFVVPIPAKTRKATRRTALIVDKQRLRAWYDEARAAGAPVTAMLPDYLCLPETPEGWTIAAREAAPDMLMVRYPEAVGFSDHADGAIALMRQDMDSMETPPKRLDIYPPQPSEALTQFLSDCRSRGIEVKLNPGPFKPEPEKGVSLLAGTIVDDAAMRGFMRQIRIPVAACVLALAAWSANSWLHIQDLSRQADALHEAHAALFSEILGPGVPMVSPRAQIERAISGMRDAARASTVNATFPDVLARIAPALHEHPAKVQQLVFDSRTMTVSLETESYAAFDRLQAALAKQGVSVEVQNSVRQDNNLVNATIVMRLQERPTQ